MSIKYVGVRLLESPLYLDHEYTYSVPSEYYDDVLPGTVVSVPFGKGDRKVSAMITNIKKSSDTEYEIKDLSSISSFGPALNDEMLKICDFLCSYTLCSFGDAVKAVAPSMAVSKLKESFSLHESYDVNVSEGKLSYDQQQLIDFIAKDGIVSIDKIKKVFGSKSNELISSLMKLKYIKRDAKVKEISSIKYIYKVSFTGCEDDILKLRGTSQKAIVEIIREKDEITIDQLSEILGKNSTASVRSLEAKGLVSVVREEEYRNPYLSETALISEKSVLSQEQEKAYSEAERLYTKNEPAAMLLHGVTGSGKTRVIKAMIDRVVSDNKSVIILVPEISLTPQTVSFFCGHYGSRVAVIHSALSQGERYDAWRRIKNGDADIVIGTRSAIFAPVKNLGMIVIDEEQEHTYKSDSNPKYYAHDVASFRCKYHNAFLLLASATPSLNTYYKAEKGIYTLVKMKERYGKAVLPKVIISDMKNDIKEGNASFIGDNLSNQLYETMAEDKQAIIFLNRRGYSSSVICRICGESLKCPNCSVSLTYHTKRPLQDTDSPEEYQKIRSERGQMTCHYCGYTTKIPEKCPNCNEPHFQYMGCGTQQAEQTLQKLIPDKKVIRMDYDTTQTKDSHRKLLNSFRNREADILLGTQMVTKGHDFPNVKLVGVLNADSSLYLDDFRASEKTFSMLTQVIGRAGRADADGVAVIQTYNPESEVLKLAAMQDYEKFYENEIKLRRAMQFPPFCDIVTITLSSSDEQLLLSSSVKLKEFLDEIMKEYSDVYLLAYGPFEMPIYKVKNVCRMRMVFKCRLNRRVREIVYRILCEFGKQGSQKLIISADFNPSSL